MVCWFDGLNVGLELRSGLLPTVWDSSVRMVRRHAITILISHGRERPRFGTGRGTFWMGTWRTLHPVPLAYMAVFC